MVATYTVPIGRFALGPPLLPAGIPQVKGGAITVDGSVLSGDQPAPDLTGHNLTCVHLEVDMLLDDCVAGDDTNVTEIERMRHR